jgi:predicted Zn-dependent protease
MARALPVIAFLLLCLAAGAQQASSGLRMATPPHPYEPPSSTATAEQLEERGDVLRLEKAFTESLQYYRVALDRTSDKHRTAVLQNKSGIVELQLEHFREAEKAFSRAIKADRTFPEPYNNLGVSYYLQKKYGKAIKQYQRALALNEGRASFHTNLASAYFMRKDLPRAMQEYRRALELDPQILERNSQAGVSAQLGRPEDRAAYEYLLAKMYAQSGDFEHSLLYLTKAMEEGYKDIKNVYKDAEFSTLRKDPRFVDLMAHKAANLQP